MGKRAFTLVELLVVMVIMMLLITLLYPAIAKALQVAKIARAKGQVSGLSKACAAYQLIFDNQAPGPIDDPPYGSYKISGAQNLWLSLIGCDGTYKAFTPSEGGPYSIITDTNSEKHPIFYTPKPDEYVAHSKVKTTNPGETGYRDGYVFVDHMFSPTERPVLYYRARAINIKTPDIFPFSLNTNKVYYKSDETLEQRSSGPDSNGNYSLAAADGLANFVGPTAYSFGFVLLSAGPDRTYFTPDDIVGCK